MVKLSRSKGQRSRLPGRFTQRGLNAWGRCSGDRENVLGVGNNCYVASARRRARRWGAHGEKRGGGISCRHAHSLLNFENCMKSEADWRHFQYLSTERNISVQELHLRPGGPGSLCRVVTSRMLWSRNVTSSVRRFPCALVQFPTICHCTHKYMAVREKYNG